EHPCPATAQTTLPAVSSEDHRGCGPSPAWKLGLSSAVDPPHDTLRDQRLRSPNFPVSATTARLAHASHRLTLCDRVAHAHACLTPAACLTRSRASPAACLTHTLHTPHTHTTHASCATHVTHASLVHTTRHTVDHNPQFGQQGGLKSEGQGSFISRSGVGGSRMGACPGLTSCTPRDQLHLPGVWHPPFPKEFTCPGRERGWAITGDALESALPHTRGSRGVPASRTPTGGVPAG
ncbi:unnamed protein product, partial [Gulo gulo]